MPQGKATLIMKKGNKESQDETSSSDQSSASMVDQFTGVGIKVIVIKIILLLVELV